ERHLARRRRHDLAEHRDGLVGLRLECERTHELLHRARAVLFWIGRELAPAERRPRRLDVLRRELAPLFELAIAFEVAVDRLLHRARRRITIGRLALHRLHADALELWGDVAVRRAHADPRIDGREQGLWIARPLEREDLEQD